MQLIKYFLVPFAIPVFLIFSSCWKNPALIRDSVVVSVVCILLYAFTFVPGLADIFDRLTKISLHGRNDAYSDEVMSGSCGVTLMRFIIIIAMYAFAYLVFTGKFVPAS